jgi:type 1 glutamine amidotransferase
MIRSLALALLFACLVPLQADDRVVYEGGEGPGKGKHIVLISGDEEYRSEEALPQLGKILSQRHGFKCTVLFPIDKDGTINPNISNIPGLETLDSADLMIIATRFRNLPDEQMQHIVNYLNAGKPVIGMRTATHAFNIPKDRKFAKYSFNYGDESYKLGFGKQVLGETWVNHHGAHGKESTRGLIAKGQENHPILRGIKDGDIWGPTDVYTVNLPLPGDSQPLVMGQVLKGMKFDDEPVEGKKNEPMMPVAWTKTYKSESGKTGRVFTTTMGSANDLLAEGTRRMLVNAVYWCVGLEDKIPEKSNVELVGKYEPSNFSFNGGKKGVRPEEHKL